jgi:hypothetical protein
MDQMLEVVAVAQAQLVLQELQAALAQMAVRVLLLQLQELLSHTLAEAEAEVMLVALEEAVV